jgi:hypothetical protein
MDARVDAQFKPKRAWALPFSPKAFAPPGTGW